MKNAKPVPSDEVYAFQTKPAGESGKVTVVRDSGAVGSGCDMVLYADEHKADENHSPARAATAVWKNLQAGSEVCGAGHQSSLHTDPRL